MAIAFEMLLEISALAFGVFLISRGLISSTTKKTDQPSFTIESSPETSQSSSAKIRSISSVIFGSSWVVVSAASLAGFISHSNWFAAILLSQGIALLIVKQKGQ